MYIVTHRDVVHIPEFLYARIVQTCCVLIGYSNPEESSEELTKVLELPCVNSAKEALSKIVQAYTNKLTVVDIRVSQTKKFDYLLNPNEVPLAEEILEFLEDINIVIDNNSRFDDDKYPDRISVSVSTCM
jgi:nicotinamide riboside kinase